MFEVGVYDRKTGAPLKMNRFSSIWKARATVNQLIARDANVFLEDNGWVPDAYATSIPDLRDLLAGIERGRYGVRFQANTAESAAYLEPEAKPVLTVSPH